MYLLTAATELEMQPLQDLLPLYANEFFLVTGVGAVETALSLGRYLETHWKGLNGVINFGVCGAFPGTGLELLDICLAEKEVLGDFGICDGERIHPFPEELSGLREFSLTGDVAVQAEKILSDCHIVYQKGNFVTVSCVSGTTRRGAYLRDSLQALCENMEGAGAARACQVFGLPCIEVRCVSNLVEDRNTSKWKLAEAARKCATTVAALVKGL
jgi:futalosine hydrolase